jgi:acetyl-CoA/propionyl-CoA carboxylase, biotin carboxylase, biotin carboxyl carrier protein
VRKILIANRGEIAVRIARACRDAGLASVAVYAAPDRDAVHVRVADQAVALDGRSPAQTYLDAGKVLRAAADSGADAVHPGYGFLAEDAGFAQSVLDAGLTWIGPPPAVIRRLADKTAARNAARLVGAPLLPGMTAPATGIAEIAEFARERGWPIVIKAVAGGGGRGIAVVRSARELPSSYARVMRAAADGGAGCFAERYLDRARHVETQCLADRHGNAVVVSTRDCSLQRRYQKIVEEAPAPFLPAILDTRLRAASRAILQAAGYVGAATCEFLLGQDGTLAFLETNARLAVASPVSEEVTGLDLVRETFRLAVGDPLGYGDPPVRGHALQFRIYAEDPARGFAPARGTVRGWRLPSGPGVRLDVGAGPGSAIVPALGTLLAKLIVTGASRAEALQRARRALHEFEVAGVATSLPLLRGLVSEEAFAPPGPGRRFSVHAGWVESDYLASQSAARPSRGTGRPSFRSHKRQPNESHTRAPRAFPEPATGLAKKKAGPDEDVDS